MRDENEAENVRSDGIREEIGQIRESVELARSDLRRAKAEILSFHSEHESHVRRTRVLWVCLMLLVGGLIGLSWYGAPLLGQQGLLKEMPLLQAGLNGLITRVNSAEQQISAWAKDRVSLSDRMSKVEQTVSSDLKTARNETRTLTDQVKREAAQSLQPMQNQVRGVESLQRENAEVVDRLRNELTGVQQQLATVREENTTHTSQIRQLEQANRQLEQANQSLRSDVSGVDRRLSSNQTAVNTLASQVDRRRVDFALPTGRTQQVADGIYVTVNHTNVERQQADGWVQIARDGRIVWLRGEGAQKPIVFATQNDQRPYQLVFTRIGNAATVGYLLVPATSVAAPTAGSN